MIDNKHSTAAALQSRMLAIDLQHLRYAVAAADYGSFRQAGEALLLQQSTLSRCIRQLEHAIGMTIFDRSNGGVQATPAGRDFLRMARSILDQMDTLVVSAYSTGRGEAGRLVIGFYTSLSAGNLRASLIEYAQRFPQITIGMIESSRIRLVTALQNGAIDLAIVTGGTPFHGNKSMSLWSERVVITLPEGHRLAAGETMVGRSPDCSRKAQRSSPALQHSFACLRTSHQIGRNTRLRQLARGVVIESNSGMKVDLLGPAHLSLQDQTFSQGSL
jgi:DNA-binding transcriptional LysR family regulator